MLDELDELFHAAANASFDAAMEPARHIRLPTLIVSLSLFLLRY